jgi:hypothetical protein
MAEVKLVLRWLNGSSLPVRVAPTATPESVLEIAANRVSAGARLIHNGHLLESYLSITYQGVRPGDTLIVHEKQIPDEPRARDRSFDKAVEGVLREVLRIHDSYFTPLGSAEAQAIVAHSTGEFDDADAWDDFGLPLYRTVIGKPLLATSPLPELREDSTSDDDEDSDDGGLRRFETIKEAAKLFSKHPWTGWAW